MSLIQSRQAYSDCREVFDKAIEDSEGVRVPMSTYNDAIYFRMRMHQARAIDRRDNKELYRDQPDHQLYNASQYDRLVVRVKNVDDRWYVYVEHGGVDVDTVEPLSGMPDMIEYEPPKQIEGPKEPLVVEGIGRR